MNYIFLNKIETCDEAKIVASTSIHERLHIFKNILTGMLYS